MGPIKGGRRAPDVRTARSVRLGRLRFLLLLLEELRQRLLRIDVRHALDKLMNGTDCVGPDVPTRIVEHHLQNHVVQWLRKVHTDLAECAGY